MQGSFFLFWLNVFYVTGEERFMSFIHSFPIRWLSLDLSFQPFEIQWWHPAPSNSFLRFETVGVFFASFSLWKCTFVKISLMAQYLIIFLGHLIVLVQRFLGFWSLEVQLEWWWYAILDLVVLIYSILACLPLYFLVLWINPARRPFFHTFHLFHFSMLPP